MRTCSALRHSHDCVFVTGGVFVVDREVFQWPFDTRLGLGTQTPPWDKRAVRLSDCGEEVTGLQIKTVLKQRLSRGSTLKRRLEQKLIVFYSTNISDMCPCICSYL